MERPLRISLDTNILIGILSGTPEGHIDDASIRQGQDDGHDFLVCGVVYTELMAHPGMDRTTLDAALLSGGVEVDFETPPEVYLTAADANRAYAERRRRSGDKKEPRRVAADFLIGAHALCRADGLMTRNPGDFKDIPVTLIVPEAEGKR